MIPTAHRVLGMPELLSIIFANMEKKDNVNNAQVCRGWSDLALSTVWSDTDDFAALLSILVPLAVKPDPETQVEQHFFSRLPTVEDWLRFERYACFVKTLSYRESSKKTPLSHAIFMDIAKTRTRFEIFPKMHTFTWKLSFSDPGLFSARSTDAHLFLHPSIRSLTITVCDKIPGEAVSQILGDIPLRSPNLTMLTIRTELVGPVIAHEISRLLPKLSRLEVVALPPAFLTNQIWNSLSAVAELRTFRCGYDVDQTNGGPLQGQRPIFSPVAPAQGLLNLHRISLYASFEDATALVKRLPAPAKLTVIRVQSETAPTQSIHSLVTALAESAPRLTRAIFSSKGHFRSRDALYGNWHPITFGILQPIVSCKALTHLTIEHPRPLTFTLPEIDSLCSSLPNLHTLSLNKAPVFYEQSYVGLDILSVTGRHCRHLQHLGVFLDATLPAADLLASVSCGNLTLPRLRTLKLGISVIEKASVHGVALTLAKTLPIACSLDYGAVWCGGVSPESRHQTNRYKTINARLALWDEVKCVRELLSQAMLHARSTANTTGMA